MSAGAWTFVAVCLMIVVSLFGCVANFLSFLVYIRPNFRPQVLSSLLACKALCDFLVLPVSCPVFVVQTLWERREVGYSDYVDELGSALLVYARPVSFITRSLSLGLLLLLVLERWFAAFRPGAHRAHLSRGHAFLALLLVLVTSLAWNVVRFWDYERVRDHPGAPAKEQPLLLDHRAYVVGYVSIAYTLSHFLFPVALLAILAACLCRNATPSSPSPSTSLSQSQHQAEVAETNARNSADQELNRAVFFLVAAYTFSYLPHFLLTVSEGAGAASEEGWVFGEGRGGTAMDASRVLMLLNAALPCFGYAVLIASFRREAKWYFLHCCLKRADRENEFTRSVRNLDRREGGSIRLRDLSQSQQRALRTSVYGKRLSDRESLKALQHSASPPPSTSKS